jgi:diadenosine tetraphosphate (Ap4A) HIT family hydrolase
MRLQTIKSLRSLATHLRYEQHRNSLNFPKCYLCDAKSLKEYRYWKIIENQYPYDEVATTSHMVVPKRHLKESGLTWREMSEFEKIKTDMHSGYDMIIENTHKRKSIPEHYHLHLLNLKERMVATHEKRPEAVFLTQAKP